MGRVKVVEKNDIMFRFFYSDDEEKCSRVFTNMIKNEVAAALAKHNAIAYNLDEVFDKHIVNNK